MRATILIWTVIGLGLVLGGYKIVVHKMALPKRQEDIAVEAAKAQEKADTEKRAKLFAQKEKHFVDLVTRASDQQLSNLFDGCETMVSSSVREENKGLFAVYFPKYDTFDLYALVATTKATGANTPEENIDAGAFDARRIRDFRQHPIPIISVIVGSATDWFSGPKRWLGKYSCELDGLNVVRTARDAREFLN